MKQITATFIFGIIALATSNYLYAGLATNAERRELIMRLNDERRIEGISFELDNTTIVAHIYNSNEKDAKETTPESFAKSFDDDFAAVFYRYFSSMRVIYHYVSSGRQLTKVIDISPLVFLDLYNISRTVSLSKLYRAKGVNMEIIPPRGWKDTVLRNQSTVANYSVGFGENQASFMIQVHESPVFLSRREVKSILDGNEVCGLTADYFLPSQTENSIISMTRTEINLYPAVHIVYCPKYIIAGAERELYTNLWLVFYEDRIIWLGGSASNVKESDRFVYDTLFTAIVSQIRFPDQFKSSRK